MKWKTVTKKGPGFIFWITAAIWVAFVLSMSARAFGMPGVRSWKAVWDPNTEPDLAGYYLYWRHPGEEFTDQNRVKIDAPEHEKDLGFLQAGTWELAVTAFDASENESKFSNVLGFTKDESAPGQPVNIKIIITVTGQ